MEKDFNPIAFKMKFRAVFAILAFIAGLVILLISMLNEVAQKSEFTGPIIGFVTGSLFTLILSFYFGSSETSEKEPRAPDTPTLDETGNLVLRNADTGNLSEITSEQVIPGFNEDVVELDSK